MLTKSSDPQLGLRLPTELKERVRKSANRNRRSMNSEIIVLIEQALPAETIQTGQAA